jgi:uncharacterized protein YycO
MKVAFYKGTRPGLSGIVNRLIRGRTNSVYSHCELVVAPIDKTYLCASSSFEDKGVRFATIALDPARWDVVEFAISRQAEDAAIEWFNDHLGQPYDLAAIFGSMFRRGHREGHWDCSESIGTALGIPRACRSDPATLHVALCAAAGGAPLLAQEAPDAAPA